MLDLDKGKMLKPTIVWMMLCAWVLSVASAEGPTTLPLNSIRLDCKTETCPNFGAPISWSTEIPTALSGQHGLSAAGRTN